MNRKRFLTFHCKLFFFILLLTLPATQQLHALESDQDPFSPEFIIPFKDPNLKDCVKVNYDLLDDEVRIKDVEYETLLHCDNYDIKYLDGIEYLYRLRSLYLQNNQIEDLSPISQLNNLTEVDLGSNNIADISPFMKLDFVRVLKLDNNRIQFLEGLHTLQNLKVLSLRHNLIEDLTWVSYCSKLESLYLSGNKLTNVKGLDRLYNLIDLDVSFNELSDVFLFRFLFSLKYLAIRNNRINSLSFVKYLIPRTEGDATNLSRIDVTNNCLDTSSQNILEILKLLDDNGIGIEGRSYMNDGCQ